MASRQKPRIGEITHPNSVDFYYYYVFCRNITIRCLTWECIPDQDQINIIISEQLLSQDTLMKYILP